jgi:hypothetical protein
MNTRRSSWCGRWQSRLNRGWRISSKVNVWRGWKKTWFSVDWYGQHFLSFPATTFLLRLCLPIYVHIYAGIPMLSLCCLCFCLPLYVSIPVSLCLICLFRYVSISVSVCLSMYQFIIFILCFSLFIYLSVSVCRHIGFYLSFCGNICVVLCWHFSHFLRENKWDG